MVKLPENNKTSLFRTASVLAGLLFVLNSPAALAENSTPPEKSVSSANVVVVTSEPVPGSVTKSRFTPTAKQLEEWNKPIKGFHPIKRIVRPIWKLRQEAQDLQDNLAKLQKPMDGLQPAFESLDAKMHGVDARIASMLSEMNGLNLNLKQLGADLPKIYHLSSDLNQVHKDLQQVINLHEDIREVSKVRGEIRSLDKQIDQLKGPLKSLQKPVSAVLEPLNNLETRVFDVDQKMSTMQTQVGSLQVQLIGLSKQLDTIQKPVETVSAPLQELKSELAELNELLRAAVKMGLALVIALVLTCLSAVALIVVLRARASSRNQAASRPMPATDAEEKLGLRR